MFLKAVVLSLALVAVTGANRQVVCHPMNNARVKRSSIPPHKTRPDSPVRTLQGPCGRSPKRRQEGCQGPSRPSGRNRGPLWPSLWT